MSSSNNIKRERVAVVSNNVENKLGFMPSSVTRAVVARSCLKQLTGQCFLCGCSG